MARHATLVDALNAGGREALELANSLAARMKALADPTRLRIMAALAANPEGLDVLQVRAAIGTLAQPTISHHLKVLREAGLIVGVKEGVWMVSTVDADAVRAMSGQIAGFAIEPPSPRRTGS